jgi:acetate kinase
MNVLVINSGSSSIKFQLLDMSTKAVLAKGLLERIGLNGTTLTYSHDGRKEKMAADIADHQGGVQLIVRMLTDKERGVICDTAEIYAVGHRVVHAGEKFNGTVRITNDVLTALCACIPLAPLHNPPNIVGIEATRKILPDTPMCGTFDTAFHQTMPEKAYIYPIPYKYYRQYAIRRYGFHGTSHLYVATQGAKAMGKTITELKIITCHLGNGSSITAIENGRSVDTTMGFTPLEGLPMGTRCGDIDPAIPLFLQRNENLTAEQADAILNRQSGMLGISEASSDMRDLGQLAEKGNHLAQLALDIFAYRIRKTIGAYMAAMNGCDLIIFTAGIGENGAMERGMAVENMEFLGVRLDKAANEATVGRLGTISAADSRVTVMVVPTNEELEIAEQTLRTLQAG